MRAVILAGGKGTRLRPFTFSLPKPLVPLDETPVLEVILRQLSQYGFTRATLAVGYLAELIQAFVQDGSRMDLRVDYSREDHPLGTAAPLRLIDDLPEHFLCMNGDLLTTLDLGAFLTSHVESGAAVSIAAHNKAVEIDLGVVETTESGDLADYIEKPTMYYLVSMGVYAFNRRALDFVPKGMHYDFPQLMLALRDAGERVRVVPTDAYWLDIGRHEDYARAQEEFARMRPRLLPDAPAR